MHKQGTVSEGRKWLCPALLYVGVSCACTPPSLPARLLNTRRPSAPPTSRSSPPSRSVPPSPRRDFPAKGPKLSFLFSCCLLAW